VAVLLALCLGLLAIAVQPARAVALSEPREPAGTLAAGEPGLDVERRAAQIADDPEVPDWVRTLLAEGPGRQTGNELLVGKIAETGSGDNSQVYNGSFLSYTITVSNPTEAAASDLLILDLLPRDVLGDVGCSEGCGRVVEEQVIQDPVGDTKTVTVTRQISWVVPSLAPGSVVTRVFWGRVAGQPDGSEFTNQVFINYQHEGETKSGNSEKVKTVVRVRVQEEGRASLSEAPTWLSADLGGTLSLDWGDFDNDGYLDLALASSVGTTVYRNQKGRLVRYWGNDRLAYGVGWADFDNDGDLELVAVGESENDNSPAAPGTNYVYTWIDDGFEDSSFDSAYQLLRVAPGDYDGDGRVDLMVSTNAINPSYPVRLYRNVFDGSQVTPEGAIEPFTGLGEGIVSVASAAISPVDADNDGDLDLGVSGFPNVTGLRINGTQQGASDLFTETVLVDDLASFLPYDFSWGDYDGDGYLDLAAAFPLEKRVRIFHNDAGAGFSFDSEIRTRSFRTPLSVDWGDLNGDGHLDLAVADAPPRVFERQGSSWAEILSIPGEAVRGEVWSLRAVDQEQDGDLDLALADQRGPSILFSNYAPLLSPELSVIDPGSARPASSVAWGDADGDGDFDLLFGAGPIGQPNALEAKLYLNDSGEFDLGSQYAESGFGPQDVAFGDVNGDNHLDVAVILGRAEGNLVYLAGQPDAPAWISEAPHYASYSAAWADADDDGELDLLVGANGPNRVYLNTGSQLATTPAWTSAESDNTQSVAWADVNGDRYLDFAAGNRGQADRVYGNNKDGTFSLIWSSDSVSETTDVAWGDFDGDGDPDLAVSNYGQATLLYRNEGGQLGSEPVWRSALVSNTTSLAWGDWDNDGDPDLALGNTGQKDVVYENLGSRPNSPPRLHWTWSSGLALGTTGVAWGDRDGDGDLDLAISQQGTGQNGFYENSYVQPSHLTDDFAPTMPLLHNPTYLAVARPGATDGAYGFSSGEILAGPDQPTLTIRYRLYDPDGTRDDTGPVSNEPGSRVLSSHFEFSLDGGGTWQPATPGAGFTNPATVTLRLGEDATFVWDAIADQAISDDARFRVTAVHENPAGPVQHASTRAISPPFRVRGTTCVWPLDPTIYLSNANPDPFAAVRFEAAVAEGSGILTFTWDFDDGTTARGQVVYHSFNREGTFKVTMTARSEPCPLSKEVATSQMVAVGSGRSGLLLPLVLKGFDPGGTARTPTTAGRAGGAVGEQDPAAPDYTVLDSELEVVNPAAGQGETGDTTATSFSAAASWPASGQGGRTARSLTALPLTEGSGGINNAPSLNADGTRVAFWSTGGLPAGAGANADGNIEIFLGEIGASGIPAFRQVTSSTGSILGGFNLSPDLDSSGERLVFYSDRDLVSGSNSDASFEVFYADLVNGTLQQLTDSRDGVNVETAISGNGGRVAYASDRDGNLEIYVQDIGSGEVFTITQTAEGTVNGEPVLDEDGSRVAYVTDGRIVLTEIGAQGQLTHITLHQDATADASQPAINGDGTRVAYVAGPAIHWAEVAPGPAVTSSQIPTSTGQINSEPEINADGTRIAFVSDGQLWFYDTANGVLTDLGLPGTSPSLSGDGTRVAFADGRELYLAVSPRADLQISKTSEPTPLRANDLVTYTIVVTNAGPSDLISDVAAIVLDQLPDEVSGRPGDGPDPTWNCIDAPPASICGAASGTGDISQTVELQKDGVVTYVVLGRIKNQFAGDIVNTAVVTVPAGVTDWNPANNADDDGGQSILQADLDIAKAASGDRVVAGGALTYTVVYTNTGPSDAANIRLTDTLPSGVSFGGVITPPSYLDLQSVSPELVWAKAWMPGLLTATVTDTLVFTASVHSDVLTGTVLTNQAAIASDSQDPDPSNNQADDGGVQVYAEADLELVKQDAVDPVAAGGVLTYTLLYTNAGPSDAPAVIVTDTLPAGVVYGGLVSPPPGVTEQVASSIVTWQVPDLIAGAQSSLVFTVGVETDVLTGTVLTNSAAIASVVPDPGPRPDNASAATTVLALADLSIAKTAQPEPAQGGGPLTYTLTYANNGPSDAAALTIADPLTTAVQFGGVVSAPGDLVFAQAGQNLTWTAPSLAAGASGTIVFTATVNDLVSGLIRNAASIASSARDDNPADNQAEATTHVAADLAITKASAPSGAAPGGWLTYTIAVDNLGPSHVVGAQVYDALPAAAFKNNTVSWQCSAPAGSTCTAPAADVRALDDTVTVRSGATLVYTVTGQLDKGLSGTLVNTATVTVPPWVVDAVTDNNSARDENVLSSGADLAIAKTASAARVNSGDVLTYTLMATNNGPSEARGLVVVDDLPAGVSFVSSAATDGSYDSNTGEWTLGPPGKLAASASEYLTLTVSIVGVAGDVITNVATIDSDIGDPDTTNNAAQVATTVNSPPSFASQPVTTVVTGTTYTYAIAVTDPDSPDSLAITAPVRPDWLALTDGGDGTATLSGAATGQALGGYSVELRVVDGLGLSATQSFTVTIVAATRSDVGAHGRRAVQRVRVSSSTDPTMRVALVGDLPADGRWEGARAW
jgi:uncharacterized repeat protein (TIGR01451 family)